MKRILSLALICALAIPAFAQTLIKENRNVPAFTGLDAASAFRIELKKGPSPSVTIECEAQYMEYVKTDVKDGVLRLYFHNPNQRSMNIKTLLKAYITLSELEYLELSGACSLTTSELFTPTRFKLDMSGASSVTGLRVHTAEANIEASGASNVNMEVNFEKAILELSGASKYNVAGTIQQAQVEVSGASKLTYNCTSDRISIYASGASNLNIQGAANQAKVELSGASSLSAGSFTVKAMSISASGASKASVRVTETLSPQISSASKLNYEGNPRITNLKVSSGASINGQKSK